MVQTSVAGVILVGLVMGVPCLIRRLSSISKMMSASLKSFLRIPDLPLRAPLPFHPRYFLPIFLLLRSPSFIFLTTPTPMVGGNFHGIRFTSTTSPFRILYHLLPAFAAGRVEARNLPESLRLAGATAPHSAVQVPGLPAGNQSRDFAGMPRPFRGRHQNNSRSHLRRSAN
jgi:hypothetical protein